MEILSGEKGEGIREPLYIIQEDPHERKVSNFNYAYSLYPLHIFSDLIIGEAATHRRRIALFTGLHCTANAPEVR